MHWLVRLVIGGLIGFDEKFRENYWDEMVGWTELLRRDSWDRIFEMRGLERMVGIRWLAEGLESTVWMGRDVVGKNG
jgi:hypothetical protein